MSSGLCSVATYGVNGVWEVPLIAGAGWVASRMLRRWGAQAEHVVWVTTLLLGVVMPALPMGRAMLRAEGISGANAGLAAGSVAAVGNGGMSGMEAGALLLPARTIAWVFAIYGATVFFFAARLLWMLAGSAALVRGGKPIALGEEAGAWWERARRAFCGMNATVLVRDGVRGVATVGARKAMILVPAGFVEGSAEGEFLSAMGHELAHIERRDYAKNLFYEAASVVVAFHPVTWWVKAQIVQTREMVCDAMVVERLVERKSYRQSLLRLAERMAGARAAGAHALGIFDANILERRIMAMKAKRAVLSSGARSVLSGAATLVLLTALVAGTGMAKGVAARAADQDGPYGTVYHPGGDVSNPLLTYAPDPVYPLAERGTPGTGHVICVVAVIVDREGMPQDVQVVRTGGKDFDASAVKAVEQYRFKPGVRFGTPVAVAIHIEVNFTKY